MGEEEGKETEGEGMAISSSDVLLGDHISRSLSSSHVSSVLLEAGAF